MSDESPKISIALSVLNRIVACKTQLESPDFEASAEEYQYLDAAVMELLVAINLKKRGVEPRESRLRAWPSRETNESE